jgi:hypothetical protein
MMSDQFTDQFGLVSPVDDGNQRCATCQQPVARLVWDVWDDDWHCVPSYRRRATERAAAEAPAS